ncbi:hypothetical protein ACT7C9_30675 [Bacillus cereus]
MVKKFKFTKEELVASMERPTSKGEIKGFTEPSIRESTKRIK